MSVGQIEPVRKSKVRWRPRFINLVVAAVLLIFAACVVIEQVALWRAQVGIETRDHDSASSWLAVSSWVWPRNAEWYFLSSKLHRRNREFEKFRTDLKEAHRRGWPQAELEYQQILALAQTGQFAAVQPHWSQLFQQAGSDGPEICKAFVNASLAKFKFENVATVISGWKADFPDDIEPYFVEAKITFALQDWRESRQLLERVIRREPEHLPAKSLLADTLFKQQDYEAAIPLYQDLIELRSSPELIASLVKCHLALNQFAPAEEILNRAMKTYSNNQELNAEMGSLYLKREQYEQAIPYLKTAISLNQLDTQSHYNLGEALKVIGNREEAQKHFRHVDQATKASLELANLTQKILESPDDISIRFRIGELTWKWKSKSEGKQWLMSVLAYTPDHQPTLRLLSEENMPNSKPE